MFFPLASSDSPAAESSSLTSHSLLLPPPPSSVLQKRQQIPDAPSYVFTGAATQYTEAVPRDGGSNFSCSYPYLNPWARRNLVAINAEQWQGGLPCGLCVKARCIDPRCNSTAEVVAVVADQCPTEAGCVWGDLDFSQPPFLGVSGMPPDRVQVAWNFTSCAPYMTNTIIVSKRSRRPAPACTCHLPSPRPTPCRPTPWLGPNSGGRRSCFPTPSTGLRL